jgi:glycosyltransferase involved in cell wall biosynthesis
MKVLIVCSGTQGILSPFVKDQMDSLAKLGIELKLFQINKKGFMGYISHLRPLKKIIKKYNPDIIHAHYGLSGLLANLQRRVPVVTTFHGSDINNPKVHKLSILANRLSKASIFVNKAMMNRTGKKQKSFLIPCGIDTSVFSPIPRDEARKIMNMAPDGIVILFSSAFDNAVKNYSLAKDACACVEKIINQKVTLIELKGYDRQQVHLLMNAADCALLTSFSEGSPQFVKEAMSCNRPIVATDVGDIAWLFGDEPGHFLTTFDDEDVSNNLRMALEFAEKVGQTNGRKRIMDLGLDSENIAKRLINVYKSIRHM